MSEVKERPILFSAPMVRAILEGRKTVTRRALNAQALKNIGYGVQLGECHELPTEGPLHPNSVDYYNDFCPFGQPGDRLWVRETTESDQQTSDSVVLSKYAADGEPVLYTGCEDTAYNGTVAHWDYPRRVRPSIHMPRWASRILLEITDVRVERLRDSADLDLLDELGDMLEYCDSVAGAEFSRIEHLQSAGAPLRMLPEMYGFKAWWDKTNGTGSFDANPWVWVVEFKQVTP